MHSEAHSSGNGHRKRRRGCGRCHLRKGAVVDIHEARLGRSAAAEVDSGFPVRDLIKSSVCWWVSASLRSVDVTGNTVNASQLSGTSVSVLVFRRGPRSSRPVRDEGFERPRPSSSRLLPSCVKRRRVTN